MLKDFASGTDVTSIDQHDIAPPLEMDRVMGSLPKKLQKFTPENGCLEYEAVSFLGAKKAYFQGRSCC